MSVIRKIQKIKDFVGHCVLWNLGERKRTEKAPFYFIDGLIAINSDESMYIGYNQPTLYALNVSENRALRVKYGIKDKDVFLGRDGNYLLFRDGNLTHKTKDLNIEAENVTYNAQVLNINANTLNIVANNINITGTLTLNGVPITVNSGIVSINAKPVAVVGGDISIATKKITTSGQ